MSCASSQAESAATTGSGVGGDLARRLQSNRQRHRFSGHVECATKVVPGRIDQPLGQVAHVDYLHTTLVVRREHPAVNGGRAGEP